MWAAVSWKEKQSGRGGQRLAHLVEGFRLDLTDPLRGHLELGREVVQRGRILLAQPARFDNPPAPRIEYRQHPLEARLLHLLGLLVLEHAVRLGGFVGEVMRRREAFLVVALALEGELLAGEPG